MKSSSIIFAATLCAAPVLAENSGTWSLNGVACGNIEIDTTSNCVVDSGGATNSYSNDESCTMTFETAEGTYVDINSHAKNGNGAHFKTEEGYDFIEVDGRQHSGDSNWNSGGFTGSKIFKWSSDGSEVERGFKICPMTLVPGWNIVGQTNDGVQTSEACHILTGADAGCISDDAYGDSSRTTGRYASDEVCAFVYVGISRISFAGDLNNKGSHFDTEAGWDGVTIANSPNFALSGNYAYASAYTEVQTVKSFKFTSDESYEFGGFKICDDKTAAPTAYPTGTPTAAPTTDFPTAAPTAAPTEGPTEYPTAAPTEAPTAACVPGQSGQGEGDCQDCGIGTYSTTYNALKCEPCLAHPANGAWTHAAGQSDANCPWGCADGHSPTHGGTKCDAEGATLSLKAGSKTALFTMHKNGALKLSGGDDICIEAPNCAPAGSTSADSHNRRLGDMGAEISTRFDALEARMAALEAR